MKELLFYFCPLAQYYSILLQEFENLQGKKSTSKQNKVTPTLWYKESYQKLLWGVGKIYSNAVTSLNTVSLRCTVTSNN